MLYLDFTGPKLFKLGVYHLCIINLSVKIKSIILTLKIKMCRVFLEVLTVQITDLRRLFYLDSSCCILSKKWYIISV